MAASYPLLHGNPAFFELDFWTLRTASDIQLDSGMFPALRVSRMRGTPSHRTPQR